MTAVADFTVPGPRPRTVVSVAAHPDPLPDDPSSGDSPNGDPCAVSDLADLVVELGAERGEGSCSDAEWIDRIARLESLKHRVAAAQSEAIHAFARQHAATQTATGTVEPEKLERSISAQIALACAVSRSEGRRRLHTARDLHQGHDRVLALFAAGRLSSYTVATITAATAHLDPVERAEVDRRLTGHDLTKWGVGRIRDLAGKLAAEIAPEKFGVRNRVARTGRRVSLRPAADGMTNLTAHLPLEQGVACYAALVKAVNEAAVSPEPVTRGRGQIMADTLVERVTGQATADAVNIEVQIVVPVEALIDPERPLPAYIPGHGPVPAELLATSAGRKAWRRLVTRAGIVVGGDSRQRLFTGHLAALIRARDGHRCTEPYCDAPIRHIDHIHRSTDDGITEFDNGRGVCEFHNYLRETHGWHVERTSDGIRTTTPTGHTYTEPPWRDTSQKETDASQSTHHETGHDPPVVTTKSGTVPEPTTRIRNDSERAPGQVIQMQTCTTRKAWAPGEPATVDPDSDG